MKNCGFSEEKAKRIEERYHQMYKVSDEWVQSKIKQACVDGYIITGLGLKVRTPILKQTPYELVYKDRQASAEARTAGNALGQGWGVLNDRARTAVMNEIDRLGLSSYVLPIASIHDANYFLVRNDMDILLKLNELCVKEAHWNDHPDIYHPEVGLGGQLDLFYPDWSNPITLPENCLEDDLRALVAEQKTKLNLK